MIKKKPSEVKKDDTAFRRCYSGDLEEGIVVGTATTYDGVIQIKIYWGYDKTFNYFYVKDDMSEYNISFYDNEKDKLAIMLKL